MINSINANQNPYYKSPTASAVNIQIFNPQAYSDGFVRCPAQNQTMMPNVYPQPVFLNCTPWVRPVILPANQSKTQFVDNTINQINNGASGQAVPDSSDKVVKKAQSELDGQAQNQDAQKLNQPVDNGLNKAVNQTLNQNYVNGQIIQYPQNISNDLTKKADKEIIPVLTQDKEKVQENKKPKVQLTDEYIMSLENYLNNSNPRIRLMAAEDVLKRFKEDETRSTDRALTALLNKIIQDPVDSIRFIGLTALDLGYAKGNDLTVKILKDIQKSVANNSYGEDPLLASQILLRMSSGQ